MVTSFSEVDRAILARRGRHLELFTIAWAVAEGVIALISAERAHSLSLAGFGIDSLIEVVSGAALMWRMSHEMDPHRRHRAEHVSLRIAGVCLFLLAAYVCVAAVLKLHGHEDAETTWAGIAVTTASVIVMPLLSRAKRKVGHALDSGAMMTDARQTDFCMYMALIVLFGLIVHAIFGIGWADSVASLFLVPLLLRAGTLSLRGEASCSHHGHHHYHHDGCECCTAPPSVPR
jgi:divalent metal cation (Fe/Co/Zn/Cd) transporter